MITLKKKHLTLRAKITIKQEVKTLKFSNYLQLSNSIWRRILRTLFQQIDI